jgi:hypothetical protein
MEDLAPITEEDFRRLRTNPRPKRVIIQVAYPRFMYSNPDIVKRHRAISIDVS